MIPRPKFLPAFTLSASKTLTLKVSNAGSYNVSVTVTIDAGTYFMAWDNQSDDFLQELMAECYEALDASAAAGADYNTSTATGKPIFWIDSSQKVHIKVFGDKDMEFDWTAGDGPEVAGILGFSSSASLQLGSGNSYTATADYQHAYGFYCDEDGQLTSDLPEDAESATTAQSRAVSGAIKAQFLGSWFGNEVTLSHLARALTFSNEIGYATTPAYPYSRNKPLECWWREARQGIRFRCYRDSQVTGTKAGTVGTTTGGSTTTLEDTGKAWSTSGQEHAGRLLYVDDFGGTGIPMRWYVASNTATVLTVSNSVVNRNVYGAATGGVYRVFNQPYRTYVVDLASMREFRPRQVSDGVDRYMISIPMLRYV